MTDSSQKFIARNRAPRVQIEYDVELYGSEKKVQLPFVMGVMSDLAGKSKVPQPAVEDRSFLEIDVDNFDDRMRAMAPRAARFWCAWWRPASVTPTRSPYRAVTPKVSWESRRLTQLVIPAFGTLARRTSSKIIAAARTQGWIEDDNRQV